MAKDNLIAALQPLVSRARTDVTAIKASTGMAWTREALTEVRLKRHLDGTMPRGVCPIKAGESTTQIALFDLDSHKGETDWTAMVVTAQEVVAALESYGYMPVVFRSTGGRGIHIFLVWDEPQDAYSVRYSLKAVLERLGYADGAKGVARQEIEVFPKQDSVPEHGFGNQFILPLAGKSAPLEPMLDFEVMPREYARELVWTPSAPVPVVERTTVQRLYAAIERTELKQLQAALATIPNDTDPLGYDEWRDLVSGIHHATGGSDEGYELAYAFSARAPHFNEDELAIKVWAWLDQKGETANPITERTIFAKAREHGWQDVASADDFEDLTPALAGEQIDLPLPAFVRDGKGRIEALLENVRPALLRPDVCGMDIRLDAFRGELVYADVEHPGKWLAFKDHHYTELRLTLAGLGFKPVGREMMRDVVLYVAEHQTVDTAQVWLEGLVWDGVGRVAGFYERYFGVEASPYTTAASRYIWTAMAGRVMDPGCQADMVPILTGAQGQGKTRGVRAMVPEDTFRELSFHQDEDARARLMRGALMVELGELSGLRSREIETIKAWITRSKEDWVPKYQEYAVTLQRRCVIQGTSNPTDLLDDPTGARRWLPMACGEVDVEAIARDRDQLWAEARVMHAAGGVEWRKAQALAEGVHDDYRVTDVWEEAIERWLATPDLDGTLPGAEGFTLNQVLTEALCFREHAIKRADEMRSAKVLRALGFRNKLQRTDGKVARRWVREVLQQIATDRNTA
jgi:hypothetical protein